MKRLTKLAKTKINLGDQAITLITDSMANGLTIDIDYMGSGMRNNILPYGWSVSNSGDLLIMCYKATGDIRSYRFDRLLQLFVEDSLLEAYNEQDEEIPSTEEPNDYVIPPLPNIDEILEISENETADEPYDEAVDILENPDFNVEDDINGIEDNTLQSPGTDEPEEDDNTSSSSEQPTGDNEDSGLDEQSSDKEE